MSASKFVLPETVAGDQYATRSNTILKSNGRGVFGDTNATGAGGENELSPVPLPIKPVSKQGPLKRKRDPKSTIGAMPPQISKNSARQKSKQAKISGKGDGHDASSPLSKKKKPQLPANPMDVEKRLRVFRKRAPLSYFEKLERARSQRMFVIDRNRGGTEEVPEETIEMAGTTGNIYSINISKVPHCSCPDNRKGNQCKHIVYVLHNVLKAAENLQYQLAFLSSELRTIFANAPVISPQPSTESSSNRKEISGDCPICFTEFEPGTEEIVWCKAACGNNIHEGCFEQWAKSQKGKEVRCVYCRAPWQGDPESLARIRTAGKMNEEGYINVGEQLGLSGERDYSSYHPYWVRRHFGGYY